MNPIIGQFSEVKTNQIGDNVSIGSYVKILEGAVIGSHTSIADHCFIENKVIVGKNVSIKTGVFIWNETTIEDDVMIGPSAVFTNQRYPRSDSTNEEEAIVLKKGCSIGANATILSKITIGQYALIGAGSVVTSNISDYALTYGNPARIHGFVCICTKKMVFKQNKFICSCKRLYIKKGNYVSLTKNPK